METTYLCYARTGKEFEVEDELKAIGIPAWCGRVIEWKRVGKRRKPEAIEKPALPNYLFAPMTPRQFYAAQAIKFLAATMMPLTRGDLAGFGRFQRLVDDQYQSDDRKRRNAEIPRAEFNPGEQVAIIGGPFAEKVATFRHVVERAHDLHPKLRLELEGFPLEVDPLDVRRVG